MNFLDRSPLVGGGVFGFLFALLLVEGFFR